MLKPKRARFKCSIPRSFLAVSHKPQEARSKRNIPRFISHTQKQKKSNSINEAKTSTPHRWKISCWVFPCNKKMADGSDEINFCIYEVRVWCYVRHDFDSCGSRGDSWELFEYRIYRKSSINPLPVAYLFQTHWGGGGGGLNRDGRVLEREGLFYLVKMVVSALHKELECKGKSSIQAAEDQKQIRPSNTWINHPGSVHDWFIQSNIYYWLRGRREGAYQLSFPEKGGGL